MVKQEAMAANSFVDRDYSQVIHDLTLRDFVMTQMIFYEDEWYVHRGPKLDTYHLWYKQLLLVYLIRYLQIG